jgi:hypothetical protein
MKRRWGNVDLMAVILGRLVEVVWILVIVLVIWLLRS